MHQKDPLFPLAPGIGGIKTTLGLENDVQRKMDTFEYLQIPGLNSCYEKIVSPDTATAILFFR